MRTTLTLDEDVAALLEKARREKNASLKEVVNQALREALPRIGTPRRRRVPFRTQTVSLGRCLIGSLDDVTAALALGEGERFR